MRCLKSDRGCKDKASRHLAPQQRDSSAEKWVTMTSLRKQ